MHIDQLKASLGHCQTPINRMFCSIFIDKKLQAETHNRKDEVLKMLTQSTLSDKTDHLTCLKNICKKREI